LIAFFSVTAHKKKIVAFLVAAALGSGVLAICSAQSAPAGQARPLFNNSSAPFANDPNFSAASPAPLSATPDGKGGGSANNPGTRELFFRMMLSVLLVVVLGAAVIYISKKFLPRITNLPGKKMHIIETAHLGPHKAVHLLKIGNQQLLIGSTSQNITKLADITGAGEHNKEPFGPSGTFSETDLSAQERNDNLRI